MRIIIALLTALAINLFMIALASIACAEGEIQNSISISAVPRLPIPSEIPQKVPIEAAEMKEPANLGFDQVASASPGMQIGLTTYDQQSNCRMNRQVDWRATQMVHFTWMKQLNRILWGDRRTAYEAWDPVQGRLIHAGSDEGGGCCIHPLSDYSGYAALDVDTEGKTVIGNHHRSSWNDAMVATVSYDYLPASCYFSAYRSRIPDSLLSYFFDPEGDYLYQWPSMEYQVWNGDTVTHVFAQQFNGGDPGFIVYFRRHGSDIAGTWDYPPKMIDTVSNGISQTVTASRVSGKVALVWTANLPAIPGGYESVDRDRQQDNDIYYMLSNNLGATWDEKQNITKSDSSKSGWRAGNDLSCLIDTGDKLHVIWDAREYSPANGGTFPHFFGSRLYHWGEQFPSQISLIKDANWDLPEYGCFGGAWNTMSIVKMQISECDGKLYALFVQFNDIFNGKNDDCHQSNWTANNSSGTANGELYVAISNDEGRKWDISRNLTNTYTPHCDTIGAVMCESDMWPAMSRFGMDAAGGNFAGVPIVDPSGSYSGTNYLDVFYVNDRYPGSCPQDEGVWTTNPVKWFRLPCVDPIPNPILSFTPKEFAFPTWVKPGHQLDTLVRLENLGNADIVFSSITAIRITGTAYDWLGVASAPTTIPYTEPSYCYMNVQLNKGGVVTSSPFGFDGIIVFNGNFLGSPDTLKIHLVIADSVQFPEWASIRTSCKKISLSNSGNLGRSGENLGNNLDFFNDCDITNNLIGEDDNARIYLRDASPFLLRIKGNDTILNSYVFDVDWSRNDGFLPSKGLTVDSTHPDYQYLYTGKIITKDSMIAMECSYWAPLASDSCDFIVQRLRIYNNAGTTVNGVFIGEIMDWDVPSDSTVENGSGADISRRMMYCYGAEYGTDAIPNNDCVLANQRYGAFAYYDGYRIPFGYPGDSIRTLRGAFTCLNSDWVLPTGHIVASQLYKKLIGLTIYQPWQSTHPEMEDSLYQNLSMVTVIGQYNLSATDTLTFVNILATEYDDGLLGLQTMIDKARSWIGRRPYIFTWPGIMDCCNKPGDANNNNAVNIGDIAYIINYLYKGGPTPPCLRKADANGDCQIDMLDCIRILKYLYCAGSAPICPTGCL